MPGFTPSRGWRCFPLTNLWLYNENLLFTCMSIVPEKAIFKKNAVDVKFNDIAC